jgi:hypothetical protein
MYLATVAWHTSIPIFSNSPWMRGALPSAGWRGSFDGWDCELPEIPPGGHRHADFSISNKAEIPGDATRWQSPAWPSAAPIANRSTIVRAKPTGLGQSNGDAGYDRGGNVRRSIADDGGREFLPAERRGIASNLAGRKAKWTWFGKVTGRDSINATISMRTDFLVGCDYREFRPYLIQHSCVTLIADLVDELATVPTIALDLEDWEPLRRTVDAYFQVQGVRVAKESGFGSANVWSGRSTGSGISAQGRQTSMQLACSS